MGSPDGGHHSKQVLEPFRREVEESGISDDEFHQFVEEITGTRSTKNK